MPSKPVVKFEQMLPVPSELGQPKYVVGIKAVDCNDNYEFDGNPIELYRYTVNGLELVDTEEGVGVVQAFSSVTKPLLCSADYAEWKFRDNPELLGPGSYLLFGLAGKTINIQAVKYTGDDTPETPYVQVGEIFQPGGKENANNDSGN